MIFFVKRTFILFLFSFITFMSNGKEIVCYRLISSTDSNIRPGAIQIISFIGDQCYESDSNGISVKNGTMQKNTYQSKGSKLVYVGGCFCGKGAKFEFNADKSNLTVTSRNGGKYTFRKTNLPSDVKTCSLIRVDSESPTYVIDQNYSNHSINYNPHGGIRQGNYDTNNGNNSAPNQSVQRRCSICKGTGRISHNDNAPANFGIEKPRQQCSECGEWYNPNVFTHYHTQCRYCHGTGYIK